MGAGTPPRSFPEVVVALGGQMLYGFSLMSSAPHLFRRFAVRGVFWREYLDWALRHVPFYLQPILLVWMTVFFFFFAASVRRALVSNFALILPGSSPFWNHLRAFHTLLNFAWTITDGAKYKLTKCEFRYEIEGAEFLDQLAAAPGAIVLTAHMGNYDLGAAIFARKFEREIRMVRAPEPDRETEQHLQAGLNQAGAGAVKVDYNTGGALLSFDLLNAIRGGAIVSIQGDRAMAGVVNETGPLFGRSVPLPSGPFSLALAAQVPIFPLFIVRTGYRRYRIVACAPIQVRRTQNTRREEIVSGLTAWRRVLENVVKKYPAQWFAFVPLLRANAKS